MVLICVNLRVYIQSTDLVTLNSPTVGLAWYLFEPRGSALRLALRSPVFRSRPVGTSPRNRYPMDPVPHSHLGPSGHWLLLAGFPLQEKKDRKHDSVA